MLFVHFNLCTKGSTTVQIWSPTFQADPHIFDPANGSRHNIQTCILQSYAKLCIAHTHRTIKLPRWIFKPGSLRGLVMIDMNIHLHSFIWNRMYFAACSGLVTHIYKFNIFICQYVMSLKLKFVHLVALVWSWIKSRQVSFMSLLSCTDFNIKFRFLQQFVS